ncbi:DUF2845 domain-containing protein [Methylobacter sp. Wu1]|uniref:DUF2845 domain-containing protein n=1 Tax=Methylobacter sp. Wu1 TaxID=3119359 RepID=UPI002F930B75
MKKILLLFGFLAVAGAAEAGFRCGNLLVETGDHESKVFERCGEPEYMEERIGYRGQRLRHPGGLDIEGYEQVIIHEWIYNFGPSRLRERLIFENGILVEIDDLEHGY